MVERIRRFLELIRFSHTVFALPFALTSAALAWHAQGEFSWLQLFGILLCMVFGRSAAMAFNRLVDSEVDAENPRTVGRHLPAGLLGRAEVLLFVGLTSAAFVGSTAIFWFGFDNPWPTYFSVPVLLFILGYSLTKRFTALCHFWLGTSLFLTPVAAWIAIRGFPDWPGLLTPLLLGGAVLFWVAGFDILYATQDEAFDKKAKLRSVPASIGIPASLRVAMLSHSVMVGFLVGLYFVASPPLGVLYLVGVIGVGVLLVYEHWLVSPTELSRVNQAFFQINGLISVGLFLVVVTQIVLARVST